jgi:broad specificity phosphatase PhoE
VRVCQKTTGRVFKDLISRFGETAADYVLVTHGALILNGLLGNQAGVDHQFIREHGLGYTTLITTEFQDDKLICISWDSM